MIDDAPCSCNGNRPVSSSHKSGRYAVELHHVSHFWHPPFHTSPNASSALQHWIVSPMQESCYWQAGEENCQTWQLANPPWYPQPTLLQLTSRKLLWLDLQPADNQKSMEAWLEWKSAQVVNSRLVCDPTIRQPGFDLPRQQRSLLKPFCTEQGHCSARRRKLRLTDTDLCPCGETQTMSHIVKYCPLTKLNGGLSWLHSADEGAISWLNNYGSWHTYEKKKKEMVIDIVKTITNTGKHMPISYCRAEVSKSVMNYWLALALWMS